MTPNQKAALRQALGTHSLGMVTKSMTPEELQELPEDYQVPTYTANASPLYDNQLFPKITSAEDLIDIGYATLDGRSTQSGQMAIALKKAGALNDDYTLNDTGKAMMANPADLLEEENLPLYLKAKELDLDGSGRELSWGETFGRFYKESKDSVKALYNIASGPAPTTKEEKAAFDLEVQAGLGGAVKSGAALAMGLSEIAGSGLIKALSDTEAEEDLALASLNQRFEKLDYEIKNAKAADVIDGLGEMLGAELGVSEAREQNIQTVGEKRTKEIEQRGESAGQFAAMFSPYGPAAMTGKVAFGVAEKGLSAAFKPISRSLLQADVKAAQVLDKTKQLAALQRQASGLQVATQAAEKKAVFAESMAQRLSQAGLVDRANNALRIANQFRTTGQEAATRLGGFTDEIATVSDDLAKATQSANVADKVLQVTQKARQIPYLPITALGKTLEATGRGMIGIDKGLSSLASKIGADKAYNAMNKITSLSGLGGAGAALGLGPAAFIPAAIKATWSTAPFIKATGEYISLVGKEATKARGQIGFWKRIYEMPNKGPAHRAVSGLMDTATMGGRIPSAVSNVGKGLVASYPVDLAYEWVSEGGDFNPNILKQAAVETLFFGGTGAALGGITMGGANRIKTLQNGDALNFYRSISDPSQRVMFNGMPSDMKRVIGTFSASNPGAKIQFVNEGAGAYDRNTKTVMVNPNAANPLKPLLTHEFMHHMLNNGIGDGVVAQLVGDGFQTGGLLRGRNGAYDPQYEAFKNEYVNRLRSQHERTVKMRDAIGDPMTKSEREFQTPDEKYLAEEYFIEVNVDDMLGMAESGKLGGIAGRMIINDKARALGDAILNKSAILRDLHFRIGGVMDNKGKMVTGNGFLSGKLYQSPEVRRMFQKMVNESVGRKGGVDAAKRKARNGIEIPVNGKNDPILGEVSSLWETDADGNPYLDASGEYIPLKKETDELRSQAGMLLVDDLKARQARNEVIPEGELSYNPDNNTWRGQYLNDRQIELLNLSGRFNSKQIKQLKLLNAAARDTSNMNADPASRGNRFSVIYQPALKKNRKGQWRYDQIKPQLRDVVPYGVEISKDGNILIRVMSTNQLFANASEKSASKRGRALYNGNMETILRDVNAVIDLHGKNQSTDAYFKDKYGGEWEQHKSFINSVFGNVGAGQKDINPLVASDRVDAVVKSYRLDRMNKATQLVGSTQLPYQNNLVKINYLPEGEPIMDANGEPKDLRYTPVKDMTGNLRAKPSENYGKSNEQQPEIQAEPSRTGPGGPETKGGGLRGQGGLPRGAEQLQPLYSPRDSGIPLEGLPATVRVPGLGKVTFGPNETARQVATDYAKSVGIDYNPPKQYAEVDEARATRIAAEYDKMPHAPNDPKVKASYDAMIKETLAQWEAIKKTGLKVEAIPAGAPNPYEASPRLAVMDVNENNHLWFFPTEEGFGTAETADIDISGNPLMAPTGEILNGHKMLANDVFRVVHDYFGHIKEGVGFRADGEENAWRSHSAMYSDLARPAMTAETRGQNSWVNYGPYGEHNRKAKGDTIYAPQKTGIMPDWVMSEGAGDIRYMPEPVSSPAKKKKEIIEQEDKGIQAPTGSLGELRSNVEIKKTNLPADALSVPKFVARENKDSDWKVMEGPLRIARGNYFTPLPNIKIKKTNEFSVQNQNLVQNAFLAKNKTPTDPKALREQQNAIRNTNASLDKIGLAVRDIEADPQKFVDPKGYAEVMKKAGVTGDVLIPPSSLKMMLEDPDAFTALLSGGYHGDKTVAGIRESAMSGLDSVVEMRELIGGRPPDLITAIHHLWGTLSKQLPPLQQEALWMRMITNKEVMQQIGESINGTFSQSPIQWKDTVKKARINTVGNYGKLGNSATSNANSFYLMLYRHNGKWGEVSDVYKNNDAVQMRYDFNTLGHGATGIKNKVQSFIGLTFGIKGNVLDRWRFVDMYLADAMKITGAKTPKDYFKYEGKGKNVPVDEIGIYKNYGTIENKSPLFSLAMYSGMDRVSQAAIDASPSLKALLGNHADPGGLHWLSWNAIKNEAVGHSSLDITKNFIKAYNQDGKFDKLTADNFLKFVNSTEAFVEGTSGGGEDITRLTLKNGVFNYTKK